MEEATPLQASLAQDKFAEFAAKLHPEPVPDEEESDKRPIRLVRDRSQGSGTRGKDSSAAATGVPSAADWQDFLGRIVLRSLTDAWISLSLRDVYDELTPRELRLIELSREDLREMSAPMATLAAKSKFNRKSGRSVIASADSVEAVFALFLWMKRVNRIARNHRPKTPQTIPGSVENYGTDGQNAGPGTGFPAGGYGIYNPGTG